MKYEPLDDDTIARTAEALAKHNGNISKAAEELGIQRSTLRYRMKQADHGAEKAAAPPKPKTPDEIKEVQRLRDQVAGLKRQVSDLARQAIDDDAMREIIGALANAAPNPPKWLVRLLSENGMASGEVPVTMWADWHYSEVVDKKQTNGVNEYNTEIAKSRARRLVDNTIHVINNHGPKNPPGIIVALTGDFVSGGLHPELQKTDELEVLPSILDVRDLLLWGLRKMADTYGKVYVPCVAGNHGRMTQKPEFKRYIYKNADTLVYWLLQRDLADDPRITIDIRDTNEVDFRVYGTRFKLVHGDMLGVKGGDGIIGAIGPIMRGEMKTRAQSASVGADYDVLLMGHWHQMMWLNRAIVANTLKGFDEYARLSLRAQPSDPSQPLFFVHRRRGITSRWEIKVEDKAAAPAEWVSWKEVA